MLEEGVMNYNRFSLQLKVVGIILIVMLSGGVLRIVAQDEDTSKAIRAEEFITNRPSKSKRTAVARYKPAVKSTSAIPAGAPPPGMIFGQLGLTTWRFRHTTAADKTKELVEEEGESRPSEWTLERVEAGTPLLPNQRVRLSIESLSRDGYLYVINREQYADGTMGDARLIFPTGRTGADGNRVKAGRVVSIPAPPRSFRIRPSQSAKVQVAELLMILVSSKPLIDPSQLSEKAITLPLEQVEAWEKQWGAPATRFEMEGGAGQSMTETEQAAGKDSSQELTQADPVPQTVYSVPTKTDSPILVTVPLKFGSHATPVKPR
jgi:hypothetical protein